MLAGILTSRESRRRSRFGVHAVVVVCLALLVLFTAIQLTHFHTSASEADHCALCVVMHSAAPVAAVASLILMVRLQALLPVMEPCPAPRRRVSPHTTRPPPAAR
jgi:hypothetical protein